MNKNLSAIQPSQQVTPFTLPKKKHNLKKPEVIGDLVGNNIAEESTKAATKNNKKRMDDHSYR